ncbi:MAG: phytanoyl-CoA dioxygenase family protein [Bacteroidetes bacterium]|nr:phytanoyl-CoA dioxygenase family protein [Bacteroidota bacterium]MCA6442227.1 phytanoyl-CoA dioxygenase family protein [Bacteroidota bacterium]
MEFILRLKIVYLIYNFFHKKKLMHNVAHYEKLGLSKKYYSPVSSVDFKGLDSSVLKPANYQITDIKQTALYKSASDELQQHLMDYDKQGYIILPHYFSEKKIDAVNTEIDKLLQNGKIKFVQRNKLMFVINQSVILRELGEDKKLCELLNSLLKDDAVLFQSINFITGSEQHTHSDSVHMTTFPLGGLLGVWIALEDIAEDNGPLHYYPGSHQLPYYLNPDYDNVGNSWMIGDKSYTAYEAMLAEKIKEQQIQKKIFKAKKGDVLIWHANLMHGGEPHTNKNKTRKSMVLHYYAKHCICYHEIKQRPALI